MNFLSLSVYWGLRFVFQRCGPISELFSSVRSEIVQDSWRAPQLNREQAPTRRQAWSKQPPSNTAQTVSWTRSCQTPWLYMQLGEHTHTHTRTWESLTAGQQSAAPLPHPTATTQTLTVRVQTADTRWEPHRNCSTELHVSCDAVEETLPGWRSLWVCVWVCVWTSSSSSSTAVIVPRLVLRRREWRHLSVESEYSRKTTRSCPGTLTVLPKYSKIILE